VPILKDTLWIACPSGCLPNLLNTSLVLFVFVPLLTWYLSCSLIMYLLLAFLCSVLTSYSYKSEHVDISDVIGVCASEDVWLSFGGVGRLASFGKLCRDSMYLGIVGSI